MIDEFIRNNGLDAGIATESEVPTLGSGQSAPEAMEAFIKENGLQESTRTTKAIHCTSGKYKSFSTARESFFNHK